MAGKKGRLLGSTSVSSETPVTVINETRTHTPRTQKMLDRAQDLMRALEKIRGPRTNLLN